MWHRLRCALDVAIHDPFRSFFLRGALTDVYVAVPFAVLFSDGFTCFLSGVYAFLGKKGRDPYPHFVALLHVNKFRMVILFLNTCNAAALADSRRWQHAIARNRVFQVVFLTSRTQANATNAMDGKGGLYDWLGLNHQNAWDPRIAWWRWWDIDDAGALGLSSVGRFGLVVFGGVMMVI